MNDWKKLVFPVIGVLALITAMAVLEWPKVTAAFSGTSPAGIESVAAPAQGGDQKPFAGIGLVDNSTQVKGRLGLATDQGVVIVRVANDSPAAAAGLKEKDVITAVDGKTVKTSQDVSSAVQAKKVGDAVTLSILRGNQPSQDIKVTLGAAPVPPNKPQGSPAGRMMPKGGLGGFLGPKAGENFRSATITLTDKDGKTRTLTAVSGTVQSASNTSISVMPNGANAPVSFDVTSETHVGRGKVEDLKAGDRVLVVAENGKATRIASLTVKPQKGDNGPRGPLQMPFHQFAPGRGGPQTPPAGGPAAFRA